MYHTGVVSFSDQVRRAVENCGVSRYAIAKASGVTEGALSRFVAGKRDMTLRTLERIAPIIGVSLKVNTHRRRAAGGKGK